MRREERFDLITEIGCVGTLIQHRQTVPCDIHHLISGNKRRGDDFTIGLSPWLHRGVVNEGWNRQDMSGLFGPSLTFGSKTFRSFWGSQDGLLAVQNLLISLYLQSPWVDYEPPYEVRRAARDLWHANK